MAEAGKAVKRVNDETRIIGLNVMRLRHASGATQRQLAKVLGTSFQQVQKYEKGQNRIPAEKLHRLRNYFGVPYAEFFEGLPDAAHSDVDNPEKSAKILYLKMKSLKDGAFRRKLFRAFMILAS